MAWLSREEITNAVEKALKKVADFSGDISGFRLADLSDRHQVPFMNAIAEALGDKGYRVTLTLSKLQEFTTMKDLIDYIDENQAKIA
jgi:hypothetical protein